MLTDEFVKPIKETIKKTNGLKDNIDNLSSIVTVAFIAVCSTLLGYGVLNNKQVLCFHSFPLNNIDFSNFMDGLCWSQNIYNFPSSHQLPETPSEWKAVEHLKITNYIYMYILLGIMAIMYFTPALIAKLIFKKVASFNLDIIMDHVTSPKDKTTTTLIAKQIILYHCQKMGYHKRSTATKIKAYLPSKESGTILVVSYVAIKSLYLINAIGQMFLISHLFSISRNHLKFPLELFNEIKENEYDMNVTMFPRTGVCYASNVTTLYNKANNFFSQCALPVNALSDKIFLFLWIWALFLSFATLFSTLTWIFSCIAKTRYNFVKKWLVLAKMYDNREVEIIKAFSEDYLKPDAHFLLQMIIINASTMTAAEIIGQLYGMYKEEFIRTTQSKSWR